MADTPEQCVARLVRRDAPRTEADVQADVRQFLLTGAFSLEEGQVVSLEAQVGNRKRIDVEVGATVIEVKKDLRVGNVLAEAVKQLEGYVAERQQTRGGRYLGVLTDGADWHAYQLVDGHLQHSSSLPTLSALKPDTHALTCWLEGVIATARDIRPTPETIEQRLGARSSAHQLDRAALKALYAKHRDDPAVRTKRALWARLLATALGTQFTDDDELFIEHTLLVNSAEVIAHAVLGLPITNVAPTSLLMGMKFETAGILNVVEADFFDWVVAVPGDEGRSFIESLARRLARFDWSAVDHDVLKVLYESVIQAETRKKLGEYYTPDWLAQQVVDAAVTDPLAQRVLDPSCGSGTFLFHAVRRYLSAADEKKIPPAEALEGVTRHVLGMDLHPVAVTFARVTYVLAIGRARLQTRGRGALHVPVYLGDSMLWRRNPADLLGTTGDLTLPVDDQTPIGSAALVPAQGTFGFEEVFRFPSALLKDARRFDALVSELARMAVKRVPKAPVPALTGVFQRLAITADQQPAVTEAFRTLCRLHDAGRDHIWGYYIRNMVRPEWLARAENHVDVLVGNPPWLSFRFMSPAMQTRFRELCEARGLWAGAKVATQQDLSALFVARAMQLFLKPGGAFAFVMPDAVLDRGQYAGFRRGTIGESNSPVNVAFAPSWDLRKVRPHFFPRECAVVFGRLASISSPMPPNSEVWKGSVPRGGKTWESVRDSLRRARSDEASPSAANAGSEYASRFRNGATIFPRVLFMVREQPTGPLGAPYGQTMVRSQRSVTEKLPWKELAALEGPIEDEFLRPVYLGESVLAFRALEPRLAVIPRDVDRILDSSDAEIDQYPGLAEWWRQANALWEKHRTNAKLSLSAQLDYHSKLSAQYPIPSQRIVYGKSGMHLAAARVVDHRAVIDHKLYWAAVQSDEEAWFLCAILNAAATTQATRPLMSRGKEERDIDTYVWQLPIPLWDEENPTHRRLAELGKQAEALVAEETKGDAGNFVTIRRRVRALLRTHAVGRAIERIVAPMLPPPWLDAVYAMLAKNEGRAALTKVYDTLDEHALDEEFDAINWALDAVDVTRLDATTMLGFLSVTLAARHELPAHRELALRVRAQLTSSDPARVDRLMEGLE